MRISSQAFFALHVEDMDMYSINFLHFGKPKHWYSVSPADYDKVVRLASSIFIEDAESCPDFLRHKSFLLNPSVLRNSSIDVTIEFNSFTTILT